MNKVASSALGHSGGFLRGFTLPLKALRHMLSRPRLLLLSLAPLTLNLILFTTLLIWGYHEFAGLMENYLAGREGWEWQVLSVAAKVLFWPLMLLVVFLIFTPVALLIGSPFNDFLSEKTENEFGVASPEDEGPFFLSLMRDVARTILAESQKLLFIGVVYAALFPLNLLPFIGSALFFAASLYWTWRWSAFEFVSYAADRRRWPWRHTWNLLKSRRALSLGFGVGAGLALYIPFLNALAVPVLAVAGGMLFVILSQPGETENHPNPPGKPPAR